MPGMPILTEEQREGDNRWERVVGKALKDWTSRAMQARRMTREEARQFVLLQIQDAESGNAYDKFTKREWALALCGLTPGGSEFLTPEECTHYVRKKTEYPRMIIELRERVESLLKRIKELEDQQPPR